MKKVLYVCFGISLVWLCALISNPNHFAVAQESSALDSGSKAVPTPIPQIAFVREPEGKHALLIGIQDYGYHPDIPSLKGPRNDLAIMATTLRERFGFQDKESLCSVNIFRYRVVGNGL